MLTAPLAIDVIALRMILELNSLEMISACSAGREILNAIMIYRVLTKSLSF